MADLIYFAAASLDGYVADSDGGFDWAAPDEQVHAFVNDLVRDTGTFLCGRRMYEVMQYWESAADAPGTSPVERDFASIWLAAVKIVYSRTLTQAGTARTRIEHIFDPDDVRRLKAAAHLPLLVGGPDLAGQALAAGVVDELQLLVVPHAVGGGTRCLPAGLELSARLLAERRFDNGTVFLRYRVAE